MCYQKFGNTTVDMPSTLKIDLIKVITNWKYIFSKVFRYIYLTYTYLN